MLRYSLEALTETAIAQLCSEKCPESRTLDFKRIAPGNSDKEKHEFLKDVCAMANADGGDLVYGIDEDAGTAGSISPITGEAEDAICRRLGQILDAGLEPRLPGIQFKIISVAGGYVLVVRVPASFDGPHRFVYNTNLSKFVMRNGTHTSELTYDQLRAAFNRTATLTDQVRKFRDERLQVIMQGRTWKPLMKGPVCVVHLIPIATMASRSTIDMKPLYNNGFTRFMDAEWGGGSRTLNLDGLVVHPSIAKDEDLFAYNQIFRTGALEALRYGGGFWGNEHIIPSTYMSTFFRDHANRFVGAVREFGFAGPAVFGAALLNVEGYQFGVGGGFGHLNLRVADRQHLVLPEVWIESIEAVTDVDDFVRPTLDVLWQAFGALRCLEYNEQGDWQPRR